MARQGNKDLQDPLKCICGVETGQRKMFMFVLAMAFTAALVFCVVLWEGDSNMSPQGD